MTALWDFSVINGAAVARILRENPRTLIDIVREAYVAHVDGYIDDVPSQFLRFSATPEARIISLPAALNYGHPVSGMKWVASFPSNVATNLPRASAVLVLNRRDTGHPFALLEASALSAARTAASAVLAAETVGRLPQKSCTIGIIGCGPIARCTLDMFVANGWHFDTVWLHDSVAANAQAFQDRVGVHPHIARAASVEALLARSQLVVFATTAGSPHIDNPAVLREDATVLHISLRDLSPSVITNAINIVDDVEHCLRANTSLHLTEQQLQHRDFVAGSIGELIKGRFTLGSGRPVVFSPFGMGMLDVAVGRYVYQQALERGLQLRIDDFFFEKTR